MCVLVQYCLSEVSGVSLGSHNEDIQQHTVLYLQQVLDFKITQVGVAKNRHGHSRLKQICLYLEVCSYAMQAKKICQLDMFVVACLFFHPGNILKYMDTNSVRANNLTHYSGDKKPTRKTSDVTAADGRVHTQQRRLRAASRLTQINHPEQFSAANSFVWANLRKRVKSVSGSRFIKVKGRNRIINYKTMTALSLCQREEAWTVFVRFPHKQM